jgi:hypothetical protein
MNQDHDCRTTPNRTPNSHPQFFIRRSEIAFDPRRAYIESVCATLIESRFGPGRPTPVLIKLTDQPERGATVFYDLCDDTPDGPNGLTPCYALSPVGRNGYQLVEAAYRRAKQMGLVDVRLTVRNSPADLTPNQGRGSP